MFRTASTDYQQKRIKQLLDIEQVIFLSRISNPKQKKMEIKLLIADDHRLFRESLSNLIVNESIKVVAQAGDGREAIEKTRESEPDVVLMDIGMDGMDGITATRKLKNELPHVKVIGLSMHAEKGYIRGMLEAGAQGYLLKSCSYDQLIDAIHAVNNGNKYLTEEITRVVVDDLLLNNGNGKRIEDKLTDRELEIFKLYVDGYSTREISEKLFVSVKTVGTHKQHIYKKLRLKSIADMIKYGISHGLVTIN